MDMHQLKLFTALAESLNFTTVAKEFYISQPAVTHQIGRLESELGAKLFHRGHRRVQLTHAGEAFYRYAVDVIDRTEQAAEHTRRISEGTEGSLRISGVSSVAKTMAACVSAFSARFPSITLEIECGIGPEQVMLINARRCDFYFSMRHVLEDAGGLTLMTTPHDRLCIFARNDIAANIEPTDFSTLAPYAWLTEPRPFITKRVVEIAGKRGHTPDKTYYYSSFTALQIAVLAGLGYTVSPSQMDAWFPEPVRRLPIPGDDTVIENAVAWDATTLDAVKTNFLEVVSEVCAGD